MLTRQSPRFQAAMERSRDPDGFARLRVCAEDNPAAAPLMVRLALYRAATIMACKGGLIADVVPGDCVELLDVQSAVQAKGGTCKTYFYQLLHDAGVFAADAPPTIRAFRDVARGVHPQVRHYQPTGVYIAAMYLICDAGVVDRVDVPPEVSEAPNVFLLKITARPWDVIQRPPDGNSILGFLGCTGSSMDEAMDAMNSFAKLITVTYAR